MEDRQAADELLRQREAQNIIWSNRARLFFLCLMGIVISWALRAQPKILAVGISFFTVGIVLSLRSIRLAKRGVHLRQAALTALVYDIALTALFPIVVHRMLGGVEVVPLSFFAADPPLATFLLLAIHALSLKPAYPLALGLVSALLQVAFTLAAASDSRVNIVFLSSLDASPIHTISLFQIMMRALFMLLVALFLAFLSYTARKTVREAVEKEVAFAKAQEQQIRLISRGKLVALERLVAGVAHELNTPLGALSSQASTLSRAAQLVVSEQSSDKKKVRASRIIEEGGGHMNAAIERVQRTLTSLRAFARLDEAEVDRIELEESLETTLALIPSSLTEGVQIERDLQKVPALYCRPREINQVLMTVLVNAFESMKGQGRLSLQLKREAGDAVVVIQDTGPGMSEEALSHLFDLGFAQKGKRMGMGLGLPIGKRIIEEHGGTLEFTSEVGQGCAVRITIPMLESPGPLTQ